MFSKNHKSRIGLLIALLAVFSFVTGASAQVADTVNQQPQLETRPPAAPTRPPDRPEETRPEPVKTNPFPPSEEPEEVQPENERPTLMDKLFVGGSGSLGFRSDPFFGNFFNIGASPILGYRLTKNFAIGPGLVYQFYNIGGNRYQDYGAKAFTQLIIYKSIFAHAEHEVLNTQVFVYDLRGRIIDQSRQNIQTTLVGGGYRQMASDRFGMDLYILFPVATSASTNVNSSQPVIRVGVIYNLK